MTDVTAAPGDRQDPQPDLVARVQAYSRGVIEAELRRLERRAPSLRRDDLEVIDAALHELVESLLLTRLRSLPQHAARLQRLFFLQEECGEDLGHAIAAFIAAR